jgi:hypothetical protein
MPCHQIRDQCVENELEGLIGGQLRRRSGKINENRVVEAAKKRHTLAHLIQRQNTRVEAVVEVGGCIGDLVGQID